MIRNHLFSEEYGRNIIWVMMSGFFLKIGAKENIFGQIIMPKNDYLFNLDEKNINNEYLKYENLHYIVLDGATQHTTDARIQNIKKKVNIYYVGKFNEYWKHIQNSQLLFPDNLDDFNNLIHKIKKKFPFFFKKYLLKKTFTTLNNTKNIKLFTNHTFNKHKYVYYGYIKPIKEHLNIYEKHLNLKYDQYKFFFEQYNDLNSLQKKIKMFCLLKTKLLETVKIEAYPYLNEFLLFIIRNILCNFLKEKNNFFIYDGAGGNLNFNAYEMFFGNQHTYIDLGSKVGYDNLYPRQALLNLSNRKFVRFNLSEKLFFSNIDESNLYLQERFDNFFENLKI